MQDVFFIRGLREINLNYPERTRTPAKHNPPRVELEGGLRERVGGKIGLLRGHYDALMAESIEYIDLPFRPDDEWIRLTDDVEIKVVEARNVPDVYHYDIEQRPESVLIADRVQVGELLPGRLVAGRQMIVRNSSGMSAGGSSGPSRISGRGDGIGRAEGIRYVIAVNPAHIRIPFEFRDIPMSAPAQTKPSRMCNSDMMKRWSSMKHPPVSALTAMRYETDKIRNSAEPVPMVKEGQLFDVDWHSIDYILNLYNPAVSKMQNTQSLSISCDAKILDPKRVIGTCDEPIIERITDGGGRDIDISLAQPRPDRMCYKTPEYRPSPTLTPPSILVQLEGKIRSALKLPLQRRHLPSRKRELKPISLIIPLDPGLMWQNQKEIGRIEGYFHALTAESYKNIEVPFKSSNRWVRLTSDLEIQVARAWHDGFKYRFKINERSKAQINPGRLHVYCPLPDGILVERRLTGPDIPPEREDRAHSPRSLPAPAGGNGLFGSTVDGNDCKIDTIDYRIAVGPTHYKIPIELEHIPLPKP
jgi:hypothetical protein